jgi:hypothetical protein
MLLVLSALWPVFALLVIGFMCRRLAFPGEGFWVPAEKLTYFLLFPVLLVDKLARANWDGLPIYEIVLVVLILLGAASLLSYLSRSLIRLDGASFTSLYQGGVRFNTYVGLAAVAALYGPSGVAISGIVIAVMIPVINVLCVLVFSANTASNVRPLEVIKTLIKNPLILSCLLGISLNLSGLGLPDSISSVSVLIGQMALPLGLLCVGAGLSLSALRSAQSAMWVSSMIKLVLSPVIVYLFSRWMGIAPELAAILLVFSAVPTAPSSYILARQLGGNADMMSAIITAQTLLSMCTLPLLLAFL